MKTDLATVDMGEVLEKWTASFDEKFKDAINACCVIKNPFDINCNLPIPDDDTSPTNIDDGDLLNESLNMYEGDYLASLSPGKRQSVAQPAAEFKRHSMMPPNEGSPVLTKASAPANVPALVPAVPAVAPVQAKIA